MKSSFRIIALFSLAGMFVTAYLIYQHYKPAGGSFCNVSDVVNCDIVNKSKYSEIAGIPVAIPGFLTYAVFFAASIYSKKTKFLGALALFAGISLIFSLYLTYVEFFVLRAICILCVTQQIIIFFIFLLFLSLWLKYQKSSFPL